MTDIVITAAKRTAIGKFMGSLSDYSAPELGKFVIEAVLNENNLDIPIMVSGTITDQSGRTLSGQTVTAPTTESSPKPSPSVS